MFEQEATPSKANFFYRAAPQDLCDSISLELYLVVKVFFTYIASQHQGRAEVMSIAARIVMENAQ
jgi:hypothetical protein